MCCCLTMMKILVIAVILQMVASDDFDWRKTRPAGLLAEVGDPSYRAMTIEDFEVVKEPLIIRFDRDWSSSDVARRQRCVVNNDMGPEMKPEHQVCFCYSSYGVDEKDDYLGCGKDYAYLCSSIRYSDFDVYITSDKDTSKLVVYRTGQVYTIPKFTVEEKVGDDGNIVPMIRLKKVQSGCGLIYLENVYKQKEVHYTQEINNYLGNLSCPLCDTTTCDAALDDEIKRYELKNNSASKTPAP